MKNYMVPRKKLTDRNAGFTTSKKALGSRAFQAALIKITMDHYFWNTYFDTFIWKISRNFYPFWSFGIFENIESV